jgi:5-methylphenazine-1-carboxylate 1-monooxygenase
MYDAGGGDARSRNRRRNRRPYGGAQAARARHRGAGFESLKEIRPLGVGINSLPHGTRELIELRLGEELAATGIEARALKYLSQYGREIMEDPRGRAAGFHWPQYTIHRGALQMILLQAVRERLGPDAVRTGHHLTAFEQDDAGVVAEFGDKAKGECCGSARGDLLIGANGIHSTVRAHLYPREICGWGSAFS